MSSRWPISAMFRWRISIFGKTPAIQVGEVRWVIAIVACFLMPVFGMLAGFALTGVAVVGLYGSDVDGAMNFFFLAPLGALTGFGVGVVLGSRFVRCARDGKAPSY
jgi:hypothetical protein